MSLWQFAECGCSYLDSLDGILDWRKNTMRIACSRGRLTVHTVAEASCGGEGVHSAVWFPMGSDGKLACNAYDAPYSERVKNIVWLGAAERGREEEQGL